MFFIDKLIVTPALPTPKLHIVAATININCIAALVIWIIITAENEGSRPFLTEESYIRRVNKILALTLRVKETITFASGITIKSLLSDFPNSIFVSLGFCQISIEACLLIHSLYGREFFRSNFLRCWLFVFFLFTLFSICCDLIFLISLLIG